MGTAMRVKTRLVLLGGCIALVNLSVPALSRPLPQQPMVNPPLPAAKPKQVKQAQPPVQQVSLSANAIKPAFGSPDLVTEARKYMGTNPTDRTRLWCATFMNFVLAKLGYAGTNSDAAKSFAFYGRRINEPRIGAIAVLTRGKNGGHVGVVSGIDDNGNPIIISGNHNKRVGEAVYARSRVIAYVMPTERGPASTMVASRGPVSTPNSDGGISSPITELIAAIEAEQSRAEARPQAAPAPRQPSPAPAQAAQRQLPASAPSYRVVQQTAETPRAAAGTAAAPQRGGNDPFSELFDHIEQRRGTGQVAAAANERRVR